MQVILLVALIAMIYTVINGGIIISVDAVRVWNRTLPCTWST